MKLEKQKQKVDGSSKRTPDDTWTLLAHEWARRIWIPYDGLTMWHYNKKIYRHKIMCQRKTLPATVHSPWKCLCRRVNEWKRWRRGFFVHVFFSNKHLTLYSWIFFRCFQHFLISLLPISTSFFQQINFNWATEPSSAVNQHSKSLLSLKIFSFFLSFFFD